MTPQKTSIVLNVQSAERSMAFYEALLGVAPGQRTAAEATFDLDSPPLILVVAEQPSSARRKQPERPPARAGRAQEERCANTVSRAHFTLIVNEPREVGDAAVALRRTGARLSLEDSGLVVCDPDENSWQVRWVPSAPARAVLSNLAVEPLVDARSQRVRREKGNRGLK